MPEEYTPELRAEVDAAMAKALKTRDACRYYSMSSFKDTPEADDVLNLAMWAVPLLTATIDAQAAEIARLREALAPFVDACAKADKSAADRIEFNIGGRMTDNASPGWGITYGHLKAARAALASTGAA